VKNFILVPKAGLEPARSQAPRDFKSLASTNSATSALLILKDFQASGQPFISHNVAEL
jgi:hypothetical protein